MNSAVPRFSIINNDNFVCWLATHTGLPTGTVPNPPCEVEIVAENVLAQFYSDEGAAAIIDEESLSIAMIAMFYWRIDNGLEPTTTEATTPVFPLFSSCPDNT